MTVEFRDVVEKETHYANYVVAFVPCTCGVPCFSKTTSLSQSLIELHAESKPQELVNDIGSFEY